MDELLNTNSLLYEISVRLRRDGVLGTARTAIKFLRPQKDLFDHRNGTNTAKVVPLWKMRVQSPNKTIAFRYETIDEREVLDALQKLEIDPEQFSFVDLGCGKGRILIIAGRYGFNSITGVEFSSDLAAMARRNLKIVGAHRVSVLEGDAADYSFNQRPTVLYLFNPFGLALMKAVLANLRIAKPHPLYIVYVNPVCADLFDRCDFLRRHVTFSSEHEIAIWCSR